MYIFCKFVRASFCGVVFCKGGLQNSWLLFAVYSIRFIRSWMMKAVKKREVPRVEGDTVTARVFKTYKYVRTINSGCGPSAA